MCNCHWELGISWGCLGNEIGIIGCLESVFGESLGCLVSDKGALEVFLGVPWGVHGGSWGAMV